MGPTTTLNAKNLEALGAQRLAELLIEISTGSAAHKRRLRLELAGNHSTAEIAREVRKRLSSIGRARTFIDWRKVKATKLDLETQRRIIVESVGKDNPAEAFELIWQFLGLADLIFTRADDGSGTLIESFHQACADAGMLAKAAAMDTDVLAERVFKAVQDNGYGQFDSLIMAMAPALENTGLERLKALFASWGEEPQDKLEEGDRKMALDKVNLGGRNDIPLDWQLARLEALEALGRDDEAQEFRWQCFEQSLSDEHLRVYLKRLPDFDDLEAEEKAFAYALLHPDVHRALHFFLRWPSAPHMEKLVMTRHMELNGDYYELMTPAAESLSERHQLAATIVLRSMIDFTLERARSSRYKHATRHLAECRSSAKQINDFGPIEPHDVHIARLRSNHGRKTGFWSRLPES